MTQDYKAALDAYHRAVTMLTGYGVNDLSWMQVIHEALSVLSELQEIVPATPLQEGMTRDIVADVKRQLAMRKAQIEAEQNVEGLVKALEDIASKSPLWVFHHPIKEGDRPKDYAKHLAIDALAAYREGA